MYRILRCLLACSLAAAASAHVVSCGAEDPGTAEQPFGPIASASPIPLPGTFEAENFDLGGEGVAYHDNTAGNRGAQYRPGEDVDIFVSDDPAGGGYIIKNFEIGEWLAYTISVPASGNYDIDLRAVTNAAFPDTAFHIEIDGVNVTGAVVLPTTDPVGWSNYQWIGKKTVALSAGTHVLKLVSEQQYFGLNQIRIAASSAPASSAGLLFRSGYEGATVLNLPTNCYGTGCWQALAGLDTSTGFAWPPLIWGGGANFQLLVDATVNASTIGDYMTNQIQIVTGRDGAPTRALYSAITQSGCCGTGPQGGGATQNPYILQPASEGGDLYIRYWLKYQPDFAAIMAGASGWNWRSVFEWKTAGDYRVVAAIKRDPYLNGGQTFWSVWGDNNANGGLPYEKFWEAQNMSVPVPVDQWFKVEVFWHRSSGADGRVWLAINGQVICDRLGPNIGVNNARINRIFTHLLYSSTTYPIYQWVDDLEIWDGFPSDASSH